MQSHNATRRTTALRRGLRLCAGATLGLGAAVLLWNGWVGRLPAAAGAGTRERAEGEVRRPAATGRFYPKDARELRRSVEGYLEDASPDLPKDLKERRPLALIVPHAGYVYSGRTAAFAYKLLEGKPKPARVILLGPTHAFRLSGVASVAPYSHYRTPLGDVATDAQGREGLLDSPAFVSIAAAHQREHSLEVQLPFLQVLWEEPPQILPVVMGDVRSESLAQMAQALRKLADPDTLFVVSTDFTHYGASFGFEPFRGASGRELAAKIKDLDMGAVRHIERIDPEGFLRYCRTTGATICGRIPVALMLSVLSDCPDVKGVSLAYSNSGEVSSGYTHSVSYYAHALYAPEKTFRKNAGPSPRGNTP